MAENLTSLSGGNGKEAMSPEPVTGNVKKRRIPSANPVIRYMLTGAGVVALFQLFIGLMMLAFHLSGSDDHAWKSGALVMLQAVFGLPWSLIVVRNSESGPLIEAGLIAGSLINGAIIGAIFGYFAKSRNDRA